MRRRYVTIVVAVSFCIFALSSFLQLSLVEAGGPLATNKDGVPFVWDISGPVRFTPDQGPLGLLSNEEAVSQVNEFFRVWEDVPTAAIRFEQDGQIETDITGSNVLEFLNSVPIDVNPIIFDSDGSITDQLFGAGSRSLVLGFAGPGLFEGRFIRQALAVLNGIWIDGQSRNVINPEIPLDIFRTAFIHEIGHFIGLDHSALNSDQAFDGDSTNDAVLPTMFPQLISVEQATLHLDDMAAVSSLYPTDEFLATTGIIRGRVLFPDGEGFQGANVVARSLADPGLIAFSSVSGFLHTGSTRGAEFGAQDPGLLGFFEIKGIPPGDYTVEISSINPLFRSGSSVGPVDPPKSIPGTPQFFVAPGQPGTPNREMATPLSIAGGQFLDSIDIGLNGRILSVVDIKGRRGTLVEVPINLSDATAIRSLTFIMAYDPNVLVAIQGGGIVRGPLIPDDFGISALTLGAGRLLITIAPPLGSSQRSLNQDGARLLTLRFRVDSQSVVGTQSGISLSTVVAWTSSGQRLGLIPRNGTLTVIQF